MPDDPNTHGQPMTVGPSEVADLMARKHGQPMTIATPETDALFPGPPTLDKLRSRAAASPTGVAPVTIEELNAVSGEIASIRQKLTDSEDENYQVLKTIASLRQQLREVTEERDRLAEQWDAELDAHSDTQIRLAEVESQRDAYLADVERLRKALRLCIGINSNRPWSEVPDSDVDGYVQAAMREGCEDGE